MIMTDLKTSHYIIISDRTYEDEAERRVRLVFNTRTTRVSALPASYTKALETRSHDEIPDAVREHLVTLGLLVPASENELGSVLEQQRQAARDLRELVYVLVPTSYCNMGCDYCGQMHVKARTSERHRAAVVDRVLTGIGRPETAQVDIRWFGGEPMLAWDAVQQMSAQFVQAADRAGVVYRSRMSTNGSLLTLKKLKVLHQECRLNLIIVTLDGVGEVHDQHRPLKLGGSSYGRIVDVMQTAVQHAEEFAGLTLQVRMNVDARNLEHVDAFISAMTDAGLNHPMVHYDLHGVYAWSNDVSAIRLGRQTLADAEARWLGRMLDLGMTVRVLPRKLALAVCPAVTRSAEVISSSGAIFSCTEHPLVPTHEANDSLAQVEDLRPTTLRPVGQFDDWHDRIEGRQVPCSSCVFLPVCGGSCPKHWVEGDPPCPPYKLNIQQRLDLYATHTGYSIAR